VTQVPYSMDVTYYTDQVLNSTQKMSLSVDMMPSNAIINEPVFVIIRLTNKDSANLSMVVA